MSFNFYTTVNGELHATMTVFNILCLSVYLLLPVRFALSYTLVLLFSICSFQLEELPSATLNSAGLLGTNSLCFYLGEAFIFPFLCVSYFVNVYPMPGINFTEERVGIKKEGE